MTTTASPTMSPADIDARIGTLLRAMTLEEKLSQLVFTAPAIERLGIPAHTWWNEGLHGVGRAGVATVFPQAIALAATWDPALMHRVATAISDEARAKHHEAARRGIRDIYAGLTYWSPNINIFRDPRWGRGQETYGEDPYLTTSMAVPFIRGLQGDDPSYLKLVATAKHYAVHSGPEIDRHHFDVDVPERDLRETYLPAFEASVKVAGVASFMGAYNRFRGEPCCASDLLLERVLRGEWGFDGYVVSDCGAIYDIHAHHRVVNTPAQAAALAVNNGCDLECGSEYHALRAAVDQGLLDEATVDRSLARLLAARIRLGMFDPPDQVPFAQIPMDVVDGAAHRALALEAAQKSIVLLKNDGLLPLADDLSSIAVIGPNADDLMVLLGNYNGTPREGSTLLAGIRERVAAGTPVYYARGCALADGIPPVETVPAACLRPSANDAGATGLTGAYFENPDGAGTPVFTRTDAGIDFIWKDTSPVRGVWGDKFAVRWTGYLIPPVSGRYQLGVNGHNHYKLTLDGAVLMDHVDIHHPILRLAEVDLEAGRLYAIELEFASWGLDPQAHLVWARPDVDELPPALDAAAKADVVIAALGLSPRIEGEEFPVIVEGFNGDRTRIELPAPQQRLLEELHKLGKPIVLVLMSGGALAVPWAAAHIPAIVQAWYPGQAGGAALAGVLFGDVNPGGRLPYTVPRGTEDLPPFDDYSLAGRTYRFQTIEPLFPFGHGLSYTSFALENLRLDRTQVAAGDAVRVSVDVTNSGARAGDEVVQLYVHFPESSVPRPRRELKGYTRLHLKAGETRTTTIELYVNQLGRYDDAGRYLLDPGTVEVMVGRSSADLPLSGVFNIVGEQQEIGAEKVFLSESAT